MHKEIAKLDLILNMNKAFESIPNQVKTPSQAYRSVVNNEVEYMTLKEIKESSKGNNIIAGVMVVPYPPGIPIMMGGESFKYVHENYQRKETIDDVNENSSILDYLIARQNFENAFPGYESDIHGIERVSSENGETLFQTLVIKETIS